MAITTSNLMSLSLSIIKTRHSLPCLKPIINSAPLVTSPTTLSSPIFSTPPHNHTHKKPSLIWRTSASPEEGLPLDTSTTPFETSQQVVSSTGGDGVAPIVSLLLFTAFVALSLLTIGVLYIGVTDFLQKREREKFEKEEAAKTEKKGGKKGKLVRSRRGPKGFGQKTEDDDAFDD